MCTTGSSDALMSPDYGEIPKSGELTLVFIWEFALAVPVFRVPVEYGIVPSLKRIYLLDLSLLIFSDRGTKRVNRSPFQ